MNAAFRCRLGDYHSVSKSEILGCLIAAAARLGFSTHQTRQTDAWQFQIEFFGEFAKEAMQLLPSSENWWVLFEFEIPRRGKRPDIVLLAHDLIFILEFKVGATAFSGGGEWQALSYALDLRDFHQGSQQRPIVPILIATESQVDRIQGESDKPPAESIVWPLTRVGDSNGRTAAHVVCSLYAKLHVADRSALDADDWQGAAYKPTPTIIEAAEHLFAGHSVADISHAFATNLDVTCTELLKAIDQASSHHERTICFVTGTPGAGKTLAGLNTVHDPAMRSGDRPSAVFLSGNGPLVKIVRAALVRDQQGRGVAAKEAARTVSTFIDNVHRFIKTYGLTDSPCPPHENAIVFDEAQRAWDAITVAKAHSVTKSEPELILEIMERAPHWCAIIALIGEGQEIHRGEAGLAEWGRALSTRNTSWNVLASPLVLTCSSGQRLFEAGIVDRLRVVSTPALHLDVSVRSPRAKRIGEWVEALLRGEPPGHALAEWASGEFPIVFTRDVNLAKAWLRDKSERIQRIGLLASSGALRLRADGIEVSSGFRGAYPYEDWFLGGNDDTRSSNQLEVAATEFECQGLELDWTGVCWGGDFVFTPGGQRWVPRKFRGTRWQLVRKPSERQFVTNKYRVLLTRARKGMVIWIPQGDPDDPTNSPDLFDATATFIESLGMPRLAEA